MKIGRFQKFREKFRSHSDEGANFSQLELCSFGKLKIFNDFLKIGTDDGG